MLGQFPSVSNKNTPSDPSVGVASQNTVSLHHILPHQNGVTPSTAPQDITTNPNYYPLPIPPEKIEKALVLYTLYLNQITMNTAPGPAPSANVHISFSTRSEQRGTSISDAISAYSKLSSITTFDEGTGEMNRLPVRVRRKLSPTVRAKAGLIRYLGSCAPCRSRRIPVSLLNDIYISHLIFPLPVSLRAS